MRLLFITMFLTQFAFADEFSTCLQTGKDCGSVAIEHAKAEEAFKKGCDGKDFYACYRMGQYLQHHKKAPIDQALKFYDLACSGKDQYGCESAHDIYMELCYDKDQKAYCGKKEPTGEYRLLVFLRTFDKKYIDALHEYDFSYHFQNKKVKELFDKLFKAKNKKFYAALKESMKSGKHDGADAEGLQWYILKLEGKPVPEDSLP